MSFVEEIAAQHQVPVSNLLVQYLIRKTRAADRGSKSRRSLGNVYALLVLAEDYLDGKTSRFTDLKNRMQELPFGSRLQNHPLDNRLNDEFSRQHGVSSDMLPVRDASVGKQKARAISEALLKHNDADPKQVASFVASAVRTYIALITANLKKALEEIQGIETLEDLSKFFKAAFAKKSDARLFEIASYVLLAEHYRGQSVLIGETAESLKREYFVLFRTGRTNANDGGIDFVLQPQGRFFQVTETLDFKKYFLDFEKVNRYPVSFVIKSDLTKEEVMARIRQSAESSERYTEKEISSYLALFDEVFTLRDLQEVVTGLTASAIDRVKAELSLQFRLEYGLLD